MLCLINF